MKRIIYIFDKSKVGSKVRNNGLKKEYKKMSEILEILAKKAIISLKFRRNKNNINIFIFI